MSNNRIKVKIELTEKQLQYLRLALFEFGEVFEGAPKERMFKIVQEKLDKATSEVESEKNFFLEKRAHKAAMKVQNSKKGNKQ